MNKELTPLEVSKQLKDFVLEFVKNGLDRMFVHASFNTIEKELKDYENLKLKHRSMQDAVLEDFKKLKALEIIKKHIDLEDYDTAICLVERKLTQKEYDLLKEALL